MCRCWRHGGTGGHGCWRLHLNAARALSLQKQSLVGKPWGGDKVEDYLRQRAAEMAATQQQGGEKGSMHTGGGQPAAAG